MKQTSTVLALSSLISMVSAHGLITSPKPRLAGTAMEAACGQQVYNNQASDSYGNIQGELQVAATQTDYNAAACDITLCKGFKYADNTANVQTYTAGQTVPITFDVRAPHTGVANVSIVATKTNKVIGQPLKSWAVFASNSSPIPQADLQFSITMPSDLGSQCATAGDCVIQHWWNAASIDQTYESCIDFTMGGSGSGAAPASSSVVAVVSSSSSVAAPASSAIAVVSSSSVASTLATSTVATTASSSAAAVTTIAAPVTSSAAVSAIPSAISSLTAALPSSVLSSVLPTAMPTGAANNSLPVPSVPLPDGFTVQDLMEWVEFIMANMLKDLEGSSRRHARALN